jgi:Ca2+-binding EF-hand superfamily protein
VFDSGNKGFITEDELCEILHNAFGMEIDAAKNLFSQVDTDSNEKITFGEKQIRTCSIIIRIMA